MARCRQCLATVEPIEGHCPVCGLDPGTKYTALSKPQRKVRLHARGIRAVAMFHLAAAGMGIVLAGCLSPVPMVVFGLINAGLAFGLARYSLLAYRGATVYYFMVGMVNVISIQRGAIHLGGILLALIALYLIGNGTSKAIFERNLSETP